MDTKSIEELNNLLINNKCNENYRCISLIADAPGISRMYAETNLLDCINCHPGFCEKNYHYYSISICICDCPLRKKIAMNYKDIFS